MRHSGSALDLRLLSSAVGWESIFWQSMTSIPSHYTGLAGEVEVWSRRVAIGACLGEEEREEEREEDIQDSRFKIPQALPFTFGSITHYSSLDPLTPS